MSHRRHSEQERSGRRYRKHGGQQTLPILNPCGWRFCAAGYRFIELQARVSDIAEAFSRIFLQTAAQEFLNSTWNICGQQCPIRLTPQMRERMSCRIFAGERLTPVSISYITTLNAKISVRRIDRTSLRLFR